MRNVGLDESQDGIKIGGRNINNLTYMDDATLLAERAGLRLNIKKLRSWHLAPLLHGK